MANYTSKYTGAQMESILDAANTLGNRNLLHNWDFRNPVNQRGFSAKSSTGSSYGYTIDRWKNIGWGCLVTKTAGYMTLSAPSSRDEALTQYFEAALLNGAHTFSVLMGSGTIYSVTASINGSTTIKSTLTTGLEAEITNASVSIYVLAGYSFNIAAVKLERGAVSTLANDPPADFGEQLAICQRYFISLNANSLTYTDFASGFGYSSATAKIIVQLPVQMRIRPSIWLSDNSKLATLQLFATEAINSFITGVAVNTNSDGSRFVELLCYGTVQTNQCYILRTTSSVVIVGLSADL